MLNNFTTGSDHHLFSAKFTFNIVYIECEFCTEKKERRKLVQKSTPCHIIPDAIRANAEQYKSYVTDDIHNIDRLELLYIDDLNEHLIRIYVRGAETQHLT